MDEEETNGKERHFNSPGVGGVIISAMLHMGKLPKEQQNDLVVASLNVFKFMVLEDLLQTLGDEVESSDQVVHRLSVVAKEIEENRRKIIIRFSTLCELLKPEVNIVIEIGK